MSQELERQTILVVDDTTENIDVIDSILNDEYSIKFAINGKMALTIAKKFVPDIILLDIMMPGMDGFEVCKALKEDPMTRNIPVIFVTAKDQDFDEAKGFEVGAVDYITKPVSPVIVKARVKSQLFIHDQQRELIRQVDERTKEINETRLATINMLGLASEYKDNETGEHIIRMSRYCYLIAKAYGFNDRDSDLLLHAAPMHDVGKVSLPDSILQKPGRLTSEEFDVIKTHCEVGRNILSSQKSELFSIASIVAIEHHEKFNGKGYPQGLVGEDINIFARIVTIADVFDALTSKRPYKDAWSIDKAVDLIKEEAGQHFDSNIVKAFVKALPAILKVKEENQPR